MKSNKYPTQWLRRSIQVGLASLVAVAGLVTFSAAAVVADANVVTAATSCASTPGAGYTITWTVANGTNLSETGTVTAATGGASTVTPSTFTLAASGNGTGGAGSAPFQSTTLTQTLPATASGTITLTTQGTWADGTVATNSGTADLTTLNCGSTSQTTHGTTNGSSTPTTTTTTTPGALSPNALLAPAVTGPPLSCSSTTVYNLTTQGGVFSLNVGNSANTSVTTIGDGSDMNALGITPDGSTLFATNQTPSNGKTTIYEKNVVAGTSSTFPNEPATGLSILIAGAYNPGNGLFYYGGWNSAGNSFILFAFNPGTGTAVEAGTVTPTNSTKYGAGDIAFDGAGNLYIMAGASNTSDNSELIVVPSPIPSSGTSVLPHPNTPLATIPAGSGNFDGIAFTTTGSLFVQDTDGDFDSVNPNTGHVTALPKQTGLGNQSPYDLAGCSLNGTLQVQKNIVGRSVAGDQFTMTITGGGVTSGNTGTTSGNTTGVQTGTNEVAGPIVGIPGTTYTVAETAASGSLSNYLTTYACLNGSTPVTTSGNGTGTSFTLSFPDSSGTSGANVICTFTNTPAGFTVTKAANPASPNSVLAGSSTPIDYTLTAKNTSAITTGTALAVSDTVPTGSTLVAGSQGCTGGPPTCTFSVTGSTLNWNIPAGVAPGGTYSLTFAVTANASDATGLISNAATFTGPGCATSPNCSTNTVTTNVTGQTNAIGVVKSVTSTGPYNAVGQTISYKFVATNNGNTTLTSVGINDTQTAPAGSLTSGPTCQSLSGPTGTCSGATTTLLAGQSATFVATYTITQADLNNGKVADSATAQGTPPGTSTPIVSTPSTANVTLTQTNAIGVVKSVTSTGPYNAVGQIISYKFVATNNGNTTLTSVGINDTQTAPAGSLTSGPTCQSLSGPTGTCSGATTTLLPGQSATFVATYTITQADLNNGKVADSATAQGTPPGTSTPIVSTPSTANVTLTQTNAIGVVKSVTSTGPYNAVGQIISYKFVATNNGNTTLTSVGINDTQTAPAGSLTSGPTCQSLSGPTGTCSGATTTLLPGQSATFVATYTITQADLNNQVVNDTATANGTPPGTSTPIVSQPSSAAVPLSTTNAIGVVKSVTSTGPYNAVGQIISYKFVATNNGNTTLTSVGITDTQTAPAGSLTSGPTCQSLSGPTGTCSGATTTLLPGQSATFVATYTITQADLNNGKVADSATAQGTPPGTSTPIVSTPSTANVTLTQTNAIGVVKSVTSTGPYNAVGQIISYKFVATNNGNTTLTSVGINDTQTAPAGSLTSGPTCQSLSGPTGTCSGATTTLLPGQSATFVATYTITQADLNNQVVNDTATANGTPPGTSTPIVSQPSSAAVPLSTTNAIGVVKSVTSTGPYNAVGQIISYKFVATNNGNTTLTSVGITDTQTAPAGSLTSGPTCQSLAGPTGTCSGATTTLLPGQSATFVATYTITQADLNNGKVADSATAQGTPPGTSTPIVSTPSTANVTVNQTNSISVVKSSTTANYSAVGDTVAYNFVVTNTGTTTLSNIAVNDTQTAPATQGNLSTVTCPDSTLAPQAHETCTATYTVTQADLDHGTVNDSATAQGTPPGTDTPIVSDPSTASVPAVQNPSATIKKTATVTPPADQNGAKLGDSIQWTYLVTNTGNVTLSAVGVNDPTAGAVTCPDPTLAPGASETCTATTAHIVTQTDVDAGVVNNTATASVTPPGTTTPIVTPPSSTTTPVVQVNSILVVKSSTTANYSAVGDTVAYNFVVTNTGTTTLSNIAVNDTQTAPATQGNLSTVTCPDSTLAPGAHETCTATYTVTQADLDHGTVNDSATAQGTPPGTDTPIVSDPSTASVPAVQNPSATIKKTATVTPPADQNGAKLGDSIQWTYLVTNNGNVTLSAVGVNDPTAGAVTCPDPTLAPGASETCTATTAHIVTQTDVDAGVVNNTATASVTPPGTTTPIVTPPSSTTTPVVQVNSILVVKSSTTANYSAVGDTVAYNFVVTNTGTTTLSNIAVNDTQTAPATQGNLSTVTCPDSTLAPGAHETCTATYTVTQADLDHGTVNDSATAQGTPPGTDTPIVSDPSTASVPAVQNPAVTVAKSSTTANYSAVGNTVAYNFLVTNTGNVTLSNIAVTDTQTAPATQGNLSAVTCPDSTLAPQAHETCTATYTVTQADLDHGTVHDSATAQGTPPGTDTPIVSDPSTATVPAVQSPSATIKKTATVTPPADQNGAKLGDSIQWTYLVTNTGNVTLSTITVNDPTAGAVTCPDPTLAPGASETCTATTAHIVTQTDVDAGVVNNTATASVTPPGTTTPIVTPPSSTTTPVTQITGISVVKSSTTANYAAVGDAIPYNFLVTNTGTVTLSNISINDTQTAPANQGNLSAITCPNSTLAPGAQETCTATYTVTQADIDNASVSDSATAQGTPPGTDTPIVSDPSTLSIPVLTTPVLTTQATTLPVTVGMPISDAATITGITGSGLPTGSVAFFVCGPMPSFANCTSTATPVTAATVPSGSDSGFVSTGTSGTFTPTVAGNYCFAAVFTPSSGTHYTATTDNQSGTVRTNECVDVLGGGGDNGTASTTTTHVSSATVTVGNKVTDAVTVTGQSGSGLPMGSVAFFVCGPTTANALCATTTNAVGTATVPATADTGIVSTGTSTSFTPTTPGIYCFGAAFTPVVGTNYAASTDNQTGTIDPSECTTVVAAAAAAGTPPVAQVVSTGPLAFTGAWLDAEVKWAILMLAFGIIAVMVARRRLRKPARNR